MGITEAALMAALGVPADGGQQAVPTAIQKPLQPGKPSAAAIRLFICRGPVQPMPDLAAAATKLGATEDLLLRRSQPGET